MSNFTKKGKKKKMCIKLIVLKGKDTTNEETKHDF